MTATKSLLARVTELAAAHGLTVDDDQVTTGTRKAGFHTLEIGTGATQAQLWAFRCACNEMLGTNQCIVTHVTNRAHPQAGQMYAEIQSLYCDQN